MGNVKSAEAVDHSKAPKVLAAIKELGGDDDSESIQHVAAGNLQEQVASGGNNNNTKWQKRVIVITTKAIYCFAEVSSSFECKRRIDLALVRAISKSTISDEFVRQLITFCMSRLNMIPISAAKIKKSSSRSGSQGNVSKSREEEMKALKKKEEAAASKDENLAGANLLAILESTIEGTCFDRLALSLSQKVQEILTTYATERESVIFTDYLIKVNKRGKEQKRILMLTNLAIYSSITIGFTAAPPTLRYNLTPSFEMKRRIPIQLIPHITVRSSNSTDFIVHVISEYDYALKYAHRSTFIDCLERIRRSINPNPITVAASGDCEFQAILMTQDKMHNFYQRNQRLSMLSRKISSTRRIEGAVKLFLQNTKQPSNSDDTAKAVAGTAADSKEYVKNTSSIKAPTNDTMHKRKITSSRSLAQSTTTTITLSSSLNQQAAAAVPAVPSSNSKLFSPGTDSNPESDVRIAEAATKATTAGNASPRVINVD
eukprot:jgi/Bigna1/74283/fgenesh1_pg.28_\